jgi:hypothetical protein
LAAAGRKIGQSAREIFALWLHCPHFNHPIFFEIRWIKKGLAAHPDWVHHVHKIGLFSQRFHHALRPAPGNLQIFCLVAFLVGIPDDDQGNSWVREKLPQLRSIQSFD